MTWQSKAAEGMPLINNPTLPERSRRTLESWWITFGRGGAYKTSQGPVPPSGDGLPHGPFRDRDAARRYAKELTAS